MKVVLTSGYSFTASTKQLDFSSTSGFDVKRLIAVINLTRNAIIYAPGVTGYTSLTGGNVLTLSYDTTGHNNADALMVLYEAIDGDATNGLDVDVTRSALPTGAATSAKQDTGNTSLASIDTKLTTQAGYLDGLETLLAGGLPAALGQGTKAQSLRVTPPSDYQAPILPTNTAPSVTSVASNNADMVASMDAGNYRFGTFMLTGTFSATVQIQISMDGTTWIAVQWKLFNSAQQNNAGTGLSTVNSPVQFFIPPGCLLRIRTTSYSSGTVAGILALSSIAPPFDMWPLVSIGNGVAISNGNGTSVQGVKNTVGTDTVLAFVPLLHNGSNRDYSHNVNALSLLTSSARTVDTNSTDQVNYNWRGCILIVNVTSAGTGSITPSIQVKDSISSSYKTVWTAAAPLTSNGMYVYALYPNSVAASFTEAASIMLSRTWRLTIVANNANSVTYSASADMQL